MVAADCTPNIRCNSNTMNVNTGRFAAEGIRRVVFFLNHKCLAGRCTTDMETPTTEDSHTMVSAKGLENHKCSVPTSGCRAGCDVLCSWAATGTGHHCRPDGVGLSKHYILCFCYTHTQKDSPFTE